MCFLSFCYNEPMFYRQYYVSPLVACPWWLVRKPSMVYGWKDKIIFKLVLKREKVSRHLKSYFRSDKEVVAGLF